MNGADYASALWVPAAYSNFRSSNRQSFSLIVSHVTDGHADPMGDAKMWQVEGHGSSAHFVIGQNGVVIQCVRLRDVAYHAHLANSRSVGIEHCARTPGELGPNDPGLPVSAEQYIASAKLQAWLVAGAGLQPTRSVLMGHAEADPATTHKRCPAGAGWDWSHFMPMVQAEYAALNPTCIT